MTWCCFKKKAMFYFTVVKWGREIQWWAWVSGKGRSSPFNPFTPNCECWSGPYVTAAMCSWALCVSLDMTLLCASSSSLSPYRGCNSIILPKMFPVYKLEEAFAASVLGLGFIPHVLWRSVLHRCFILWKQKGNIENYFLLDDQLWKLKKCGFCQLFWGICFILIEGPKLSNCYLACWEAVKLQQINVHVIPIGI